MGSARDLLDALLRGDWATVREVAQSRETPKDIKDMCNAWLRHDRGRQLAFHDLRTKLQAML